MSVAAAVPWVLYSELVVGQGHPTLLDITNRPAKFLISQSDLDSTQPFPGFLGRYLNAGSPETVVAANVGVSCIDTTNGDLYIKKTGTTNAGWQLVGGASSVATGTIGQFSKFLSPTQIGNTLVSETTGITVAVGANAIVADFAPGTLTKAGSGTHALFAAVRFQPPTINAGAANLTEAATVYITGAPAVGTNLYALHVASGVSIFGTDPGAPPAGTPIVKLSGDLLIGSTANPAIRLWNKTATARQFTIYVGNGAGNGFLEIFDDTASVARLNIDSTGLLTVPGSAVFGGGASPTFRFTGSSTPQIWLVDTGEAADNKKWRIYSNTGSKQTKWQTLNDAENASIDFLRITRVATTSISLVEFPSTAPVRLNGAVFGMLGLKADWNTLDGIGFENGGAGTYDTWRIGPGAGNGLNQFSWFNGTAAAIEFGISNTGILQLPQASIANGASTVTITNVRPAAAASATITGWLKINVGGVDRYIPYWS